MSGTVGVAKQQPFVLARSGGTERHELTSWTSFDSIFRFFGEALQAEEAEEEKEEAESSNIVTTRSSSLKNKHQDL
ncbi:unnamed protein product [Merluccius merluccius]